MKTPGLKCAGYMDEANISWSSLRFERLWFFLHFLFAFFPLVLCVSAFIFSFENFSHHNPVIFSTALSTDKSSVPSRLANFGG